MQKNLLVFTALVAAIGVYAADTNASKLGLKTNLYAFHNPDKQIALHAELSPDGLNEKGGNCLKLQMYQGERALPLIELRRNQLLVGGKEYLKHISVRVAGGYPKDFSERPYSYLPKQSYCILHEISGSLVEKVDGDIASDSSFSTEIQTLEDCTKVLDAFKESKSAAVIINLRRWLDVNYDESERKNLPVIFIEQSPICYLDFDIDPIALTQAEYEREDGCCVQ